MIFFIIITLVFFFLLFLIYCCITLLDVFFLMHIQTCNIWLLFHSYCHPRKSPSSQCTTIFLVDSKKKNSLLFCFLSKESFLSYLLLLLLSLSSFIYIYRLYFSSLTELNPRLLFTLPSAFTFRSNESLLLYIHCVSTRKCISLYS